MQQLTNPGQDSIATLSLRELTEVLIKHKGIHEGLYDTAFQFHAAFGAVGPRPEEVYPGAIFGIAGVGLAKAEKEGPHTVDAAKVNPLAQHAPAKKPRTKKS